MLSRRRLVRAGGVLSLAWLAACGRTAEPAPPAPKVHRIAHLWGAPPNPANTAATAALLQALRELGYVEGQNLVLDERRGNGDDRLLDPAAELVHLQPEVVLVNSPAGALAVQATSRTIPIVSTGFGDLVASGLATSHARPGGNVTGLSTPLLAGKQLQLLQESVPSLARVAVLVDTTLESNREPYETAARSLGIQVQYVGAGGAESLAAAFEAAAREQAEALFVSNGPVITANHTRIAELTVEGRLPSMWQQSDAVGRGGLMAYGPNRAAMHRRAAYFVDRILKGASPADVPIEQPREFDFVINLRTAQALGLTIPQHVLLQATEVIQ